MAYARVAQLAGKAFSSLRKAPRVARDVAAEGLTGLPYQTLRDPSRYREAFRANPLLVGSLTAGGGAFLGGDVIKPIVTADPADTLEMALKRDRRDRALSQTRQIEQELLRNKIGENISRLAAVDPQLYNEVMAGRRLPQGAMVFGGQPRGDLMEQLAMDMAMGRYPEPMNPAAELAALEQEMGYGG